MSSKHMPFAYDDGGRAEAGYKPHARDCVTRAVAIATAQPYQTVYEALAAGTASERRMRRGGATSGRRTARAGVHVTRKWFKDYMTGLGWMWVPTMQVGQGAKVHLVDGELPPGRLIVSVSRHYTAVVDGVVRDTYDPQRSTLWPDGRVSERCVYGYWIRKAVKQPPPRV